MGERLAPSARITVTVAFLIGLGILLFDPFSWDQLDNAIHEEKRIAVWQEFLNRQRIEDCFHRYP